MQQRVNAVYYGYSDFYSRPPQKQKLRERERKQCQKQKNQLNTCKYNVSLYVNQCIMFHEPVNAHIENVVYPVSYVDTGT